MKKCTFGIIIGLAVAGCGQSDDISVPACSTRFDCAKDQYCDQTTLTCRNYADAQCRTDADCNANEVCDNATKSCIDPSQRLCSDDSDCNVGMQCDTKTSKCVDIPQQTCKTTADCKDGLVCDTESKHCIAPEPTPDACTNGKLDAGETDIDCGGSCPACANGKKCQNDSDCTSGTCIAHTCTTSDCINATAESIEISEVFTNPIADKKMEHTASNQQKFIELHNTTASQIRLDNLTFTVGNATLPLTGCLAPNIYLVIHPTGTPLEALTITGRAYESDAIAEHVATNGNFAIELKHGDTRIHAVNVPDMTGKDGISAALPPADKRTRDEQGRDALVPHDTITPDEDGEHPYSPGLHNQAVLPQG